MKPARKWKVLESETVLQSPYIRVRKEKCLMPDGRIARGYYLIDKKDVATVVALTPEKEVVLVEEYKHGAGKVVLQLPTGFIEPKEKPAEAAARELEEETGFRAKEFRKIASMVTSASDHTNKIHVFVAEGAKRAGKQKLDDTEDIVVRLVPWGKAVRMALDGGIDSLAHVAALLLAKERLGKRLRGAVRLRRRSASLRRRRKPSASARRRRPRRTR